MIRIDEKFLNEVGLAGLPEEKKENLMKSAQQELERRVGERMIEGMTVTQLREFEGVVRGSEDVMMQMLSKIADYQSDEVFQRLLKRHNLETPTSEVMREYLSVKWIRANRPDYAKIIRETVEEIRAEIIESKADLLA